MTPLSNLYSVISTWNLDANGNWNVSGNWTPATFPNAIGDTANFLNVITANRIITLGQNITIGNINFDNSNNYTISGSTLIFSNAGTANLNVTNSNGNGLHSITSAVTLNSSLLMTHSSSSNFTFSGAIGGVGAFTKEGIGTLVFDGPTANTYTGLTTINNGTLLLNKTTGINAIVGSTLINTGGTLLLGTANQIVNTGLVTISGGTFNLGGNAETIGSLVFNSGTLTQGGATLTLTNTAATALTMGNNTTIAGPITFTSTGGVTYNGTTTRASIAGNLAMGPSATAHTFNINNGTDSIDLDISSVISGTAGITKTGTGVLQLSGTSPNTYTALTTISAGELILNKTSGINALAGSVTVNNGGTLTLGAAEQIINTSIATFAPGSTFNMGGFNETIGALIFTGGTYNHGGGVLTLTSNGTALSMGNGVTITGNIALTGTGTVTYTGTTATATMSGNLDLGTGIHTFSAANGTASTDVIFSGIISGSGAITMLASSPLSRFEFSGASPNTHTGLFTLSRGTLFLNKPSGIAIAGNFRINDNDGTVILGAPNQFADTSTFTHSSGTFIMNGFNETIGTYTFSSGTLNQGGATLSFNDPTTALTMRNTTINGNIAILNGGSVNFNPASGGTATISGNIDLGSITPQFNILNGPLATDMLISGTISSSGAGLNSIGPGVLQFSGGVANTYTGLTTISAGMLLLNKTPGINALPGNALINGGILALGGADQILDTASITLDSGEFNMSGFNETIGTLIFNGGVFNHGGGTISLTNPISALTMRDTTITGNVNLTGGGSILFDSTNNGTATISGNIDLGSFATNFNISDGSSATDMLISGIISGAGAGLNKTGLGLLEFSGSASNTYTGLTTISAGTLLLNKISGLNALPENALINGGILALGGADQILDTATVTLDSGEFNMSGFNETIGTLIFNGGIFNQGGGIISLTSPVNALTMRDTTITGNMNLIGGGEILFDSTNNGTATISGNIDLGSFTTNFNISDGSSATDMLISGSISGTGAGFNKTGLGFLEFSGSASNTYTELTTISAGTLLLNKIPGNNALPGNALIDGGILVLGGADQILDTATVTLDSGEFNMSGFNETIGTLIYNGGAFNQGGGTVSLASPINALTMRNTTITGNMNLTSGGSVIFDSANNGTATISGNIDLGSFTTNFNISDGSSPVDMLISGSIANGGVDKMGEGTLVLTGSNTYSGGTLISTGTLQGNSISLQNNITNNANLIFDQTFDGTYADMISGTGNFLKQGSGNLILSNINTVGGSAIISNGTLTVNGTFEGGGPLILDSGATLRGTGTIVKDTTIRGTLATGDGLGALNFVGDQILDSGSTLEIEFNATSHDSFDIMGSLNIQPNSTLKLLPQMDIYPDSFSYNIVQTTTGISGSFTTVTSTLPMFIATVTYTPLNIILLKVALIPFSTFFPDGNAGAVAECLDSTTPTSSPDFSFIISQLRALPTIESIKDALLQMQPSAFTALAVAQENNTLNLKNAIYNHLKKQTESCAFLDTGGGLNFWISPFVTRTLLGNKNEEPGFSANSPGVIGGMDFLSPQGYFFGVSVGYNQTKLHWSQHRGKAGIHSTHVSLYGLWESYFGYLQGILMGESVSYSTVRNIEFGSLIDRKAKGHHGGKSGSLHLKGALKYNYEGVVFSPFVAGDYLFLHENGFREKGAGSLNLKVKNKNSDLLSSQIGVDVSSCYRYKQVSLAPFIQLSAIRESRFIGNHEKAKFNDCPLEVKGLYPSKTLGEVLVGVNTSFPKNSSLTLLFQGKYSEGYRNESLQLQYQHTF
jgi:fibronectin-binding autotransporter adhesin